MTLVGTSSHETPCGNGPRLGMVFDFHSFGFWFLICLGSFSEPFLNCAVKLWIPSNSAAHVSSDIEIEFTSHRSVLPNGHKKWPDRRTSGNDIVKIVVNSVTVDCSIL